MRKDIRPARSTSKTYECPPKENRRRARSDENSPDRRLGCYDFVIIFLYIMHYPYHISYPLYGSSRICLVSFHLTVANNFRSTVYIGISKGLQFAIMYFILQSYMFPVPLTTRRE